MDDSHARSHAGGLPLQGPHWHPVRSVELPPDFQFLRLVLQPTGQSVDLDRPIVVVGRHSEADVRLPLPDVSRRHCRFTFADGVWSVVDLNSLNGTYVNGDRVATTVLASGDSLRIGSFTFTLELLESRRPLRLVSDDQTAGEDMLRSIADALPRTPRGSSHSRKAS